MKKPVLIAFVAIFAAGCVQQEEGVADLGMTVETLEYTLSDGPSVMVRGKEYPLGRREGRDKQTGEVFVVEYYAVVDGRRTTCVSDPQKCIKGIEFLLDNEDDPGSDYP